jgi:hypothetical protein
LFEQPALAPLLDKYSGEILSKKILRPRTSPRDGAIYVRRIVGHVLRQLWLSARDADRLRSQYTRLVCKTLMGLEHNDLRDLLTGKRNIHDFTPAVSVYAIMPAVAATIGDVDMLLRSLLHPDDVLKPGCDVFPSALTAAVSADSIVALKVILKYVKAKLRRRFDGKNWYEVREAVRAFGHVVQVAIRLHRNDAGRIIFRFLHANPDFRGSLGQSTFFGNQFVKDCIRHGNTDLMESALAYSRIGNSKLVRTGQPPKYSLTEWEESFLLKRGHPKAVEACIKLGFCVPKPGNAKTTPLQQALENEFMSMAHCLVEKGADVNAPPGIGDDLPATYIPGSSMLWHAASDGAWRSVKFLLLHGAVENLPNGSAHRVAYDKHWNKCTFLFRKAAKYGKHYLNRPDLWDIYKAETKERHKYDDDVWDI